MNLKLQKLALLLVSPKLRDKRPKRNQNGMALLPHQSVEMQKIAWLIRLLQKCCVIMQSFVASIQTTRSRSCWRKKPKNRWQLLPMVVRIQALSLLLLKRKATAISQTPAICLTCIRTPQSDLILKLLKLCAACLVKFQQRFKSVFKFVFVDMI